MAKKLTDQDLDSLENVANKELELIEEGISYVKELSAWRAIKVLSFWIMEWLFYFVSIATLVVFVWLMFYTTADLYKFLSQYYAITSVQNEESILTIIKIVRIFMFALFFIFFISALQFRGVKNKLRTNNNLQLVFEDLKELIKRRKTKFNI